MEEARMTSRSISAINFLAGIWLIISPYILGYNTGQAMWQQTVAGVIIALMAIIHYAAPSMRWTSWINALAGIWMIVAPFATGYTATVAYWNEVILGIIVAVMALWNAGIITSDTRRNQPAS